MNRVSVDAKDVFLNWIVIGRFGSKIQYDHKGQIVIADGICKKGVITIPKSSKRETYKGKCQIFLILHSNRRISKMESLGTAENDLSRPQ